MYILNIYTNLFLARTNYWCCNEVTDATFTCLLYVKFVSIIRE